MDTGECNEKASDAEQENESGDQLSATCCRSELWEVEFAAEAGHYMTFSCFSCFYCAIKNIRGYTHTKNLQEGWIKTKSCTFAIITRQK